MSEFSIQSVTGGKLCLHFLSLGWKILIMLKSSKIVKQFLGHWKMHGIFGAPETARFLWS